VPVLPTAEAVALEAAFAQDARVAGSRRKVTPTTVKGAVEGTFVPADVFYSFRGMTDALTYWLPANLNASVRTARSFRQLVR